MLIKRLINWIYKWLSVYYKFIGSKMLKLIKLNLITYKYNSFRLYISR